MHAHGQPELFISTRGLYPGKDAPHSEEIIMNQFIAKYGWPLSIGCQIVIILHYMALLIEALAYRFPIFGAALNNAFSQIFTAIQAGFGWFAYPTNMPEIWMTVGKWILLTDSTYLLMAISMFVTTYLACIERVRADETA
jgi:hypothetical protein